MEFTNPKILEEDLEDKFSDITASQAGLKKEQDEPIQSVFSAHWNELAGMLDGDAKKALSEHLERTQELATSAAPTPRSVMTDNSRGDDALDPPNSARSDMSSASTRSEAVDAILEAHSHKSLSPAKPIALVETDEEFIARKERESTEEFAAAVNEWRLEKAAGGGHAQIVEAGGDFGQIDDIL